MLLGRTGSPIRSRRHSVEGRYRREKGGRDRRKMALSPKAMAYLGPTGQADLKGRILRDGWCLREVRAVSSGGLARERGTRQRSADCQRLSGQPHTH